MKATTLLITKPFYSHTRRLFGTMTDKYLAMTKDTAKFRHDPRQMAVIKTLDEYSQQITSA